MCKYGYVATQVQLILSTYVYIPENSWLCCLTAVFYTSDRQRIVYLFYVIYVAK